MAIAPTGRRQDHQFATAFALPQTIIQPRLGRSNAVASFTSRNGFKWSSRKPVHVGIQPSHRQRVITTCRTNVPELVGETFSEQVPDGNASPSLTRISRSLWKFSRPHTIYGTFISVLSVSILGILTYALPLQQAVLYFATAIIPALLLNIYIVGLNQLYDISIDRVNKPYLPLASGAMTYRDAQCVIAVCLISGLAFCLSPIATNALRVVLLGSVALGTMYSMPPVRLKRFALLASMAILTVRGLLVNIGFFLHAIAASPVVIPLGGWILPPVVSFASVFFTLFGIVIALLKDVPDIKGDRLFGIRTFSVRMGAASIFQFCVALLVFMFLSAGAFYFSVAPGRFGRVTSMVLHAAVAAGLAWRARSVDVLDVDQVTQFYMLSWKAFYAEYLLLPLALL